MRDPGAAGGIAPGGLTGAGHLGAPTDQGWEWGKTWR